MKIQFLFSAYCLIFSSSGRSPGRAIVLPPALALALASAFSLAKSLMLKFFMLDKASYPVPVTGLVYIGTKFHENMMYKLKVME